MLGETSADGRNDLFERLLDYQDRPDDDDKFWGALHTIESISVLAPWLISHADLERMASNPNFSVRSAAASICMRLSHFAPELVPLDILLKLSAFDEDWYVQAPANAALQALVQPIPEIIQIFYNRLGSSNSEEREHASYRILGIAREEPELLERDQLRATSHGLEKGATRTRRWTLQKR